MREDGSKDDFAEKKLATEIEDKAAPIVSRVIDNARTGRELGISSEERHVLTKFLRIQNARTRPAREVINYDELIDLAIRKTEMQGHTLTEKERKLLNNKVIRDRMKNNVWVRHLSDDHFDNMKSMDILMRKSVGVMLINKSHKSFIIGDYPVIRGANEYGSGRLEDTGVKEILPVAHDVIIYWGRERHYPERIIVSDNNTIRIINETILRQSSTVAGRSQDLLKSLSRSKAARVPPLVFDSKKEAVMREVKNNMHLIL